MLNVLLILFSAAKKYLKSHHKRQLLQYFLYFETKKQNLRLFMFFFLDKEERKNQACLKLK